MATPKEVRDAAQHALHTLFQTDPGKARDIYGGLRTWAMYGWRGMSKQGNQQLAKAKLLIASLPTDLRTPLTAYLTYPAKQLYDAKGNGFIAPPEKDAGQVGPLPEQFPKDLKNAANALDLPGILSTLLDPDTWLRVAEVALGAALIIVGLLKLTNAASLIGSATPVGRVAKALT